jgi:hypothetical protein
MNTPTPLGKTYKEYQKELKEFKLSSAKIIHLSLADDIRKVSIALEEAMTELNKSYESAESVVEEVMTDLDLARKALAKKYNDLESKFKPVDGLENKAGDLLSKTEKAAKELGFNLKDIPGYTNLENLYDNADGYKNRADDVLDQISKIQVNL